MLDHRPSATLGAAHHGWLEARHHFSFAGYHDPQRMGWGAIRVWNDDRIAPGYGFPPHAHRDMEIVTYVLEGAITHEDSQGGSGTTGTGDVQVMSAGTGIVHSEINAGPEVCRLFQIWILPDRKGLKPQWAAKRLPAAARRGCWETLASGFAEDIAAGALAMGASARLKGAMLAPGEQLELKLAHLDCAYCVPASGRLRATARDGRSVELAPGDGLAIGLGSELMLHALERCELVTVEARG